MPVGTCVCFCVYALWVYTSVGASMCVCPSTCSAVCMHSGNYAPGLLCVSLCVCLFMWRSIMYVHVSAYELKCLHVESLHTCRDRAYLTARFCLYVHMCWREEGARAHFWIVSMMVCLGLAHTCFGEHLWVLWEVSGLPLLRPLQLRVQPSPAAWGIWGMKGRNFPEWHSG